MGTGGGAREPDLLRISARRHRQRSDELWFADADRVVVACPDLAEAASHAKRIKAELEKVTFLKDVQFHQQLDYPTVPVAIDRDRAGLSGLNAEEVAQSVLVATNSSRYAARNYWRDMKSGVDYQVEVLVPTRRMDSAQQVETLPIREVNANLKLLVRDVARVKTGSMPGEIDRSSMQRFLSVTANVEGEDLGRAARQIEGALSAAGTIPRGVRVETRGQPEAIKLSLHSRYGTFRNLPREHQPCQPVAQGRDAGRSMRKTAPEGGQLRSPARQGPARTRKPGVPGG
jgi:multidrug efflux pump subunit AcrB